jgi:hypothetical protein
MFMIPRMMKKMRLKNHRLRLLSELTRKKKPTIGKLMRTFRSSDWRKTGTFHASGTDGIDGK